MSNTNHDKRTPGPWVAKYIERIPWSKHYIGIGPKGWPTLYAHNSPSHENDAAFIVACENACTQADIVNPAAIPGAVRALENISECSVLTDWDISEARAALRALKG